MFAAAVAALAKSALSSSSSSALSSSAVSAQCTQTQNLDCNGNDVLKITNDTKVMTAALCCQLCEQHSECKVAVLVPRWQKNLAMCELKDDCEMRSMSNRVRICPPKSSGSIACGAAPAPTPPPIEKCNSELLPVFCDPTKSVDERTDELISKMTTAEKLAQVGANGVPSIDRLGVPGFQWWGEALHGVCQSPSVHFQSATPNGTSFPEPIGVGSTFNPKLFAAMGEVIGSEARVMMNAGNAGGTFWAPNINIVKDPRWGRLQETPGECPILSSAYAALFVSNFQHTGLAKEKVNKGGDTLLRASSCCKHLAAYSEENWNGLDRYHFDSVVSKQEWTDTYEPTFQACAVEANASGLMCSYNALNGVPTCADKSLMTGLMREEFGFYGYITGDCGAAADVFTAHKYTATAEEGAAASIMAGMDVDCGDFLKQHLPTALEQGARGMALADLDRAVARLFALRVRLGLFDPPSFDPIGYRHLSPQDLNYTHHSLLSLRAARTGIVLLQNKHTPQSASPTLPISPSRVHSVAVIGPNADAAGTMQGVDCHGVPPFLITPRMAFNTSVIPPNVLDVLPGTRYNLAVAYEKGCAISGADASGIAPAAAAAAASDLAVLVVGLDQSQEYEMRDRDSLLLPPIQQQLVDTVAAAAAAKAVPVVVVIMSGGVIDVSAMLANENVSAVLWCGYPGQQGGTAIAEIILGAVSPSGRAPLTWYPESYLTKSNLSAWDMGLRPNASSTVKEGRTYRFYTGKPLFEFGFGLGYQQYSYSDMHAAATATPSLSSAAIEDELRAPTARRTTRLSAEPLATVSVTVNSAPTNADAGTIAHSVLLFASAPGAGQGGKPIKTLAGFARLPEDAAFPFVFRFNVTAFDLSVVGTDGLRHSVAGKWKFVAGLPDSPAAGPTAEASLEIK